MKKEGEDCGFPPNGTTCHPDVIIGLCGEGLECYKLRDDCSPGICKKTTTGKNKFMISTSMKGKLFDVSNSLTDVLWITYCTI